MVHLELLGALWLQSHGVQHPHSQLFCPRSDPGWWSTTSVPSQPAEGLLSCGWPLHCAREQQQGGGMNAVRLVSWAANSDTGWVPQLTAGYLPASCTRQEEEEASARPRENRKGSRFLFLKNKQTNNICLTYVNISTLQSLIAIVLVATKKPAFPYSPRSQNIRVGKNWKVQLKLHLQDVESRCTKI